MYPWSGLVTRSTIRDQIRSRRRLSRDCLIIDFKSKDCLIIDFKSKDCLIIDFMSNDCLIIDFKLNDCLIIDFKLNDCLIIDIVGDVNVKKELRGGRGCKKGN